MAKFLAMRRWNQEEIPILLGSQFHLKAILEENTLIDPTLQDNVLLPNDFAEHICHVGSSHDLHSIVQSGLIPAGEKLRTGGMRCSSQP